MPVLLLVILSIFDICRLSQSPLAPVFEARATAVDQTPYRLAADTLTLKDLESRALQPNDTLYVVNFWATWCKPCVKELPFFEEAGMKFAESPVKILLVSLDMLSDIHKVDAFAATHLRRNEVYLLRAGNPDVWINALDPQWSGAIPATVFYRKGKKLRFHEGELTEPELFQLIHSFLP